MDTYDHPVQGLQDYDVPPPQRTSRNSSGSIPGSRRGSVEPLRSPAPGSRVASLGNDLYDTPPGSKRSSAEAGGGLYDTPPSSKRASSERTPPHSNRSSLSRESGSNGNLAGVMNLSSSQQSLSKQNSSSNLSLPSMMRRRSGSRDNCYDTPPGSNRSSLERILSEEGPPVYDTLSASTSLENLDEEDATYDVPPSRPHILSQSNPASQMSLRSAGSIESLLSNNSGPGGSRLSHNTSLPDSARSSMDLPADTYDVPPAQLEVERRKQLSTDSGLGFYDSPSKSRLSSSSTGSHSTEPLKTSQSAQDCKQSPATQDFKRSKSVEHALDDIYDVPRNNAPKVNLKKAMGMSGHGSTTNVNDPSSVYDIPPQVTRDSVISMRSDSSDESTRFSSSSFELESVMGDTLWEELLLDEVSALELLTKRQQDVNKATYRLCSFVNDTWRTRASLEKTLYDIKVSCSYVKNSLNDYVTFAKGAVTNASKYTDKYFTTRLSKMVIPLQSTMDFIKKSFSNLEEMKWQVSLLAEPFDKTKLDDLGHITLLSKEIMPEVKKVSAFIQSNSSAIFRKASAADSKKPISTKPPIGPTGLTKTKGMAHRPLPAVPPNDAINGSTLSLNSPSKSLESLYPKKPSIYDIKAALHQDDYAECDELPDPKDREQDHKNTMEQCIQEYDYVQIDALDDPKPSETSEENSPSKNDAEDVATPTNKESNSCLSNTSGVVSDISAQMSNLSVLDADVDMVPVRDCGSSEPSYKEIVRNLDSSFQSPINGEDFVDSAGFVDPQSPADSEKTPINSANSDSSSFILPSDPSKSPPDNGPLDPNDRQVLTYYTDQINTHSTLLANAVDAFIGVVESNQPPNVFISHGKFVIVSAHKLVYIGDSIHRNLISNTISTRVMQCANTLCDYLKASVTATKTAALQYPSQPAVQEMVNKVIAVSRAAQDLKKVITQSL